MKVVLRTQETYFDKIAVKASGTQIGTKTSVSSFLSHCMEKGIGNPLVFMKKSEENCFDLLQGWINSKSKNGMSAGAIRQNFSNLKGFLHYMGINFEGVNIALLIGTAGVLGTFLAITDPVGRLLQSTLKRGIRQLREKSEHEDEMKWNFATNAIKTRAIGIEIDKFVSMFYLGLILLVFSSSVTYFPDFAENLQLYGHDEKIICNTGCAGIVGVIFAGIAGIFLALVGMKSWRELKNNAIIAGIHHRGISSEYVTTTTIENMSRAIEQNDWQTASEWAKIIESEIKTEKGKKDFNIEAVREIYRPLYEESLQNDVAAKNILNNNVNTMFSSKEWDRIQSVTKILMIKDKKLIKKIDTLYEKIKEYNQHPPTLEGQIKSIIHREATKFYGMNVEDIHYFFKREGSGSSPALWDCLRSKQHPLERNTQPYDYRTIELQTSNKSSKELNDEEDIVQFDKLWDILLEKVDNEINLSKLGNQVKEIQNLNNELKPIFEDQIRKQWL